MKSFIMSKEGADSYKKTIEEEINSSDRGFKDIKPIDDPQPDGVYYQTIQGENIKYKIKTVEKKIFIFSNKEETETEKSEKETETEEETETETEEYCTLKYKQKIYYVEDDWIDKNLVYCPCKLCNIPVLKYFRGVGCAHCSGCISGSLTKENKIDGKTMKGVYENRRNGTKNLRGRFFSPDIRVFFTAILLMICLLFVFFRFYTGNGGLDDSENQRIEDQTFYEAFSEVMYILFLGGFQDIIDMVDIYIVKPLETSFSLESVYVLNNQTVYNS